MSEQHALKYLPVDLLVPNGWNPQDQDEVTFQRLVDEVKPDSTGFIDVVQVVAMDDGTYRILGGEHRWLAAKAADLEEVPCFPLGTLVSTTEGLVPIEAVEEGTCIFDKDGVIRTVVQKHERLYEGEVVVVRAACWNQSVAATPNHPFFVLDRLRGMVKRSAEELRIGDSIYFAAPVKTAHAITVDLTSEIEALQRLHPRVKKSLPLVWEITPDLGWWLGMYLAEGSASGSPQSGIRFTLGSHELELAARLCRVTQNFFGLEAKVYQYGTKLMVNIYQRQLYRLMSDLFGSNCYEKHLPWAWLATLSDEALLHIIAGVADGDGCATKPGSDRITVSTTSYALVSQLFSVLSATGHGPSVHGREARVDAHGVNHSESWNLTWNPAGSKGLRSDHVERGVVAKITRLSREWYQGPVFNLGVAEEHSYRANGYPVANCIVLQGEKWKDEDLQKFVTVRLNTIRGKIDPEKFLKLYREMAEKYGTEALQGLMGYTDQKAFQRLVDGVKKGMRQSLPKDMSDEFEEKAKEAKSVEDLQKIIQTLFTKYGDTVKHSFMIFTHGKQEHVYVAMDRKMARAMTKVTDYCKLTGTDINEFMAPIINDCMREAAKRLAAEKQEMPDRLMDEPENTGTSRSR